MQFNPSLVIFLAGLLRGAIGEGCSSILPQATKRCRRTFYFFIADYIVSRKRTGGGPVEMQLNKKSFPHDDGKLGWLLVG